MINDALVAKLTGWAIAYYQGKPVVTDEEFDEGVDLLRSVAPTHPLLTTTAWGATAPDWDIPHWSHVAGLDQRKIEQISAPAGSLGEFCWTGGKSVKLDGLTGVLRYDMDGFFIDALTRGTGDTGKDISAMALATLCVPKRIINHAGQPIQIRGEFALSWKAFSQMIDRGLCREDTHPRNVAAGCMNGSDPEKAAYVDFIAFSVADQNGTPMRDQEEICEELDIAFVDNEPFFSCDQMEKVWADSWKGSKYEYPTDGIVLADETGLARLKIKFPSEDVQEMEIGSIEMRKTRTGRIIPHGSFKEPKFISGCWIRNCTLNNITWCRSAFDLPIWVGAKVMVRRANEIIPEIVTVLAGSEVPDDAALAAMVGLKPEEVFMEGTDLRFESAEWMEGNVVDRILGTALPKGYATVLTNTVYGDIVECYGQATIGTVLQYVTDGFTANAREGRANDLKLTPSLKAGYLAMTAEMAKRPNITQLIHFLSIRGVGDSREQDIARELFKGIEALGDNNNSLAYYVARDAVLLNLIPAKYHDLLQSLLDGYCALVDWSEPEWLNAPAAIDESTIKGRFSMTGKINGMKKDELAEQAKAAGWLWDDKAFDVMVSDADRLSTKMQAAIDKGLPVMSSADFLAQKVIA